ncbi:hypothetical protein ADS79_02335 [Brevibacillus reuszeri]|uniref:Uncharacterized protein n=1 Tax=Brevibacillus reuszeri TaxID=54915 RepID=A0A0K9Z0R2_9BACL|nr:hypothetical protein ADS79_02335 [Brevibacillus reuszeri]
MTQIKKPTISQAGKGGLIRIHGNKAQFLPATISLRRHDPDQVQWVDGLLLPSSQPRMKDSPSCYFVMSFSIFSLTSIVLLATI